MQLVNEFTVNRPIAHAWKVLTDIERIAPCLPGAQLQEIEGDKYRGVVKVKVGPISAALKGEASFVEQDDENHRAVLKGEGRDTKGNGNASALITASAQALSPTSTKVVVHTDLNMTGKVAQFGRGALADISAKLMQQFAKNLDEMLAKDGQAAAPAADTSPTSPTSPTLAAAAAAATVGVTAPATPGTSADNKPESNGPVGTGAAQDSPSKQPTMRTINGPAAEPIDAFSLGGGAILKRVLPLLAGLVILLLAIKRFKK